MWAFSLGNKIWIKYWIHLWRKLQESHHRWLFSPLYFKRIQNNICNDSNNKHYEKWWLIILALEEELQTSINTLSSCDVLWFSTINICWAATESPITPESDGTMSKTPDLAVGNSASSEEKFTHRMSVDTGGKCQWFGRSAWGAWRWKWVAPRTEKEQDIFRKVAKVREKRNFCVFQYEEILSRFKISVERFWYKRSCMNKSLEAYWYMASLVAQMIKNPPAMQETHVQSLAWEGPWKREWLPTPVFLPGGFHEQRSLVSYSPRDCKESEMTEQLTHMHTWEYMDLYEYHKCQSSSPRFWGTQWAV